MKPLSKILSGVLTLINKFLKSYSNYKFKFDNTSGYWIVNNKDVVIDHLNFLNNTSKASSIKSFDFKKLYTNLPHAHVITSISELINFTFTQKQMRYINVSKNFVASWSNKGLGKWAFTNVDLVEMFTFLIENIYVTFGDMVYRQIIGIPMGSDCAPIVADLFLFYYEFEYISRKLAMKDPVICKLRFCGRYIDDLNIPNADNEVINVVVNDIYPKELKIVDTNPSNKLKSTFLDLEIAVVNNSFSTKLYDKRRDFQFNVISMPNLRSNIPNKQAYGIFLGELYRIAKSSSVLNDFVVEVKRLLSKLCKQNFNKAILIKNIKKFITSKPACLHKFWSNISVNMFYDI